ncbi:DUF397 domain-containing protein [Streptomyces luteireticuli]|uniref:DUF397 domain-containing protein n=1 Tax=Streptomyces luteireticuli TaxID=173858 RepID=A0ABN0YM18_9ACTN
MTSEAAGWHTSSYTGPDNNCVEHAPLRDSRQAIRDTKDPDRRITLVFSFTAWQSFVDAQKGRWF